MVPSGMRRAGSACRRDGHRHADLADFAGGQHVIRIIAGLGRQVEGDGRGLSAPWLGCAGRARSIRRGGVAGIGAEDPRLVAVRGGGARDVMGGLLGVLWRRQDRARASPDWGQPVPTRIMLQCSAVGPQRATRDATQPQPLVVEGFALGDRQESMTNTTTVAVTGDHDRGVRRNRVPVPHVPDQPFAQMQAADETDQGRSSACNQSNAGFFASASRKQRPQCSRKRQARTRSRESRWS